MLYPIELRGRRRYCSTIRRFRQIGEESCPQDSVVIMQPQICEVQTAPRTSGCLSQIKPHRRSSAWSPVGESTPARAARIHAIARGACGCLHPNIAEADRTFHNQRGAVLRIPAPCTASVSPSRTTIPPAIASTYAIGIPDYSDVEISAVSFVTTIDDFVGVTEPN